jgi:hypothetical protein
MMQDDECKKVVSGNIFVLVRIKYLIKWGLSERETSQKRLYELEHSALSGLCLTAVRQAILAGSIARKER